MSSTASRILKNSGWLYAKMGITMFISLYTTRLILNGLGASDYGIFNLVGSAIAMLGFLNAALAATTQRFISYTEGEGDLEKKKVIFNVSIVLHFIIALIMGVALVIIGYFFFHGFLNIPVERIQAAKYVYGSLIISTIFSVMTVPYDAVMNSHENMKYYAIVGIFESILKLFVAIFCIYTNYDKLIVYGVLMAIIPLVTLSIMRTYCHTNYKECQISLRNNYQSGVAKEILGFAGWTFTTTVTSMITLYGMGVIINHFFSVVVNAAYGIAMQLNGMLMAFSLNAQKAFNPILTKSEGAKNRDRVIYIALFGCRISYFIFCFFSLPIMLMMPVVLQLWLKEVPEWAVIFCQLQLTRTLLEQLVVSLLPAINAEGNIKKYSQMRSITYVLPLILVPLAFWWGLPPYWLFIMMIISWSIFGGIGTVYYACNNINMSCYSYFKIVLLPCLLTTFASIIPFVIGVIVGCEPIARIELVILQVILFLLLGIIIILNKEERNTLLSLTKSISFRVIKSGD